MNDETRTDSDIRTGQSPSTNVTTDRETETIESEVIDSEIVRDEIRDY